MIALGVALVASGQAGMAQSVGSGTISVERAEPGASERSSDRAVDDAVGAALANRGFTLLNDSGHSAYVADFGLTREDVGTGSAKLPAEKGSAMAGGVSGVGGGVTLPLSAARSRTVPLERITLRLSIRKRGAAGTLWEGTAVTVRPGGTRVGSDAVAAADLGEAVLRFYPDRPPGIVTAP